MAIRNILSTPDWHDSVDGYTALAARNKGPKIATSYNSSPLQSPSHLPSLRSSRPGQIAVFSPYDPSSGSTPFASNPYPALAFTGVPQPALTSHHHPCSLAHKLPPVLLTFPMRRHSHKRQRLQRTIPRHSYWVEFSRSWPSSSPMALVWEYNRGMLLIPSVWFSGCGANCSRNIGADAPISVRKPRSMNVHDPLETAAEMPRHTRCITSYVASCPPTHATPNIFLLTVPLAYCTLLFLRASYPT